MPDLSHTSPPRPAVPPAGGEADDGAALIQALGRPFSVVTVRGAPAQARALKTVERILAAGRTLGLSLGRPPAPPRLASCLAWRR